MYIKVAAAFCLGSLLGLFIWSTFIDHKQDDMTLLLSQNVSTTTDSLATSSVAIDEDPRTIDVVAPFVKIRSVRFPVEVADTPLLRERGLSGRESLREGTGLLFVFDTPAKYGFWMKGMKFSIDIVWFDADGQILTIADNVAPETFPKTFAPDSPALYVLEVPSGTAEKFGWQVGDKAGIVLSHFFPAL